MFLRECRISIGEVVGLAVDMLEKVKCPEFPSCIGGFDSHQPLQKEGQHLKMLSFFLGFGPCGGFPPRYFTCPAGSLPAMTAEVPCVSAITDVQRGKGPQPCGSV